MHFPHSLQFVEVPTGKLICAHVHRWKGSLGVLCVRNCGAHIKLVLALRNHKLSVHCHDPFVMDPGMDPGNSCICRPFQATAKLVGDLDGYCLLQDCIARLAAFGKSFGGPFGIDLHVSIEHVVPRQESSSIDVRLSPNLSPRRLMQILHVDSCHGNDYTLAHEPSVLLLRRRKF